jgi:hypothetical protein
VSGPSSPDRLTPHQERPYSLDLSFLRPRSFPLAKYTCEDGQCLR